MRELSAADKRAALEVAKEYLTNNHTGADTQDESFPGLRTAISEGLKAGLWWFVSVGSKREKGVTIEVARVLNLAGIDAIDAWDDEETREFADLIKALDDTIEYLK